MRSQPWAVNSIILSENTRHFEYLCQAGLFWRIDEEPFHKSKISASQFLKIQSFPQIPGVMSAQLEPRDIWQTTGHVLGSHEQEELRSSKQM